jgi:tetratricopeptide (TPR) repeat protein
MATTKKISRKEIKEPDEFISFWSRAIEFAQLHTSEIVIGVASAVVILLLIWAGISYRERREAEASELVGQAQSLLRSSSPGGERQQAEGQKPGEGLEAREQGREILERVVEDFKRTKASQTARILLGQIYYEKGEYDAAVGTYDDFLKRGTGKPELTAMAWEGLAYAHEARGDFAKALGCYEKLRETTAANFQAWAYMGLARCYEKLGEPEKALDAYRALLTNAPDHPMAMEAKASIARITQSIERAGPPPQPEPPS